ncbi:MAG: DUF1285 domain-containing protein [Parahaliea sp.]
MPENRIHTSTLGTLAGQVGNVRNFDNPPLHLWHPPLSGEMDLVIRADGRWWHEGVEIKRTTIVQLFAAILRREGDGQYYLVTPVEKWRICVESHAFIITRLESLGSADKPQWLITLNTGRQYPLNTNYPLYCDPYCEGVAAVRLDNGLSALCSRSAWYRLVAEAREINGKLAIHSDGQIWPLM